MVEVNCSNCSKIIKIYKYRLKTTKRFFCADCWKEGRKTILASYSHLGQKAALEKIAKHGLSKAQIAGLATGRYKGKKTIHKGDRHHNWKGDAVGYAALHDWIERERGRPQTCEHCNTKNAKRYEWSNISGKYKRIINDWQRLCSSCHIRYDRATFPSHFK